MKQVIQNYSTGELHLEEVPVPVCGRNSVLVKNIVSLISVGTERSIIELGAKSLLGKARARPDLVRRFKEKARKEGILKTFREALNRLDAPTALGYSCAGVVVEVGSNVNKFSPGDRVACIGAGYASHAQYVSVPEMLCAHIPRRIGPGPGLNVAATVDNELYSGTEYLSYEEASFGMLGIIALHGVRCARLGYGESVAVVGLGLLGLLTVQILVAYGFKVVGIDPEREKVEMARRLGALQAFTEPFEFKKGVDRLTSGYGADAVMLTAATKDDGPVNLAVDVLRFGGKLIVVGVTDIHPQRNEMWHKEVEIIVSKAGGPGTLDIYYENRGVDYPLGHVRWTEGRNLEEFLRLMAGGSVNVMPLVTHRFPIDRAEEAYKGIIGGTIGRFIAVVLNYNDKEEIKRVVQLKAPAVKRSGHVQVGVVGAGLFGKSVLLPALHKVSGATLKTISTSSGANAFHSGMKFGFERTTTDYHEIITDEDINAVFVLTPHNMHASQVCECLEAGKHVFVEKPLCVNKEELNKIVSVYEGVRGAGIVLMVGYNRRFSPHSTKIAGFLEKRRDPMVIVYRVNAGYVPPEHWVHSEEQGGGRIIGEMCHFVDEMQFITASAPTRIFAERISSTNTTSLNSDNVVVVVKFGDGSVGSIIYSASGDRAYSREELEIFCEGKVVSNKDYRVTEFYALGKSRKFKTLSQQMGYVEELNHFIEVAGGKTKASFQTEDFFMSTAAVLDVDRSLKEGIALEVKI